MNYLPYVIGVGVAYKLFVNPTAMQLSAKQSVSGMMRDDLIKREAIDFWDCVSGNQGGYACSKVKDRWDSETTRAPSEW